MAKGSEAKSVYALLGFKDHKSMEVKARLASQISDVIKRRRLNQVEAAEIVGMTQPKPSNMLRGQFRGISESKMMDCLVALGKDVEIVIKSAPATRHARVMVTKYAKPVRAAAPRKQVAV